MQLDFAEAHLLGDENRDQIASIGNLGKYRFRAMLYMGNQEGSIVIKRSTRQFHAFSLSYLPPVEVFPKRNVRRPSLYSGREYGLDLKVKEFI